jgi:hypothetical protein
MTSSTTAVADDWPTDVAVLPSIDFRSADGCGIDGAETIVALYAGCEFDENSSEGKPTGNSTAVKATGPRNETALRLTRHHFLRCRRPAP